MYKNIIPLGQKVLPLGRKVIPLGRKVIPLGQKVLPLGRKVFPLGRKVFPLGRKVFPLGQKVRLLAQKVDVLTFNAIYIAYFANIIIIKVISWADLDADFKFLNIRCFGNIGCLRLCNSLFAYPAYSS